MTPEQRIEQLEQRLLILEQENNMFRMGRTYFFNKDLSIRDAYNIELGTTTGTKIGTSATQKLGLYGVTPVVQYGNIDVPSGGVTIDSVCRDKVTLILLALRGIGILPTP